MAHRWYRAAVVRIYLTGRVAIEVDGAVVAGAALGTGQLGALLAMLACERHRAVSSSELAEHLWADAVPAAWAQGLRSLVSKARDRLGRSAAEIPHWMGCYQLRLPADAWVDVECAEAAIHEAERELEQGRPEAACGSALVAASITRDPFLPGWSSAWCDARRAELDETRIRALECLAEVWLMRGAPRLAARDAAEAVARNPYREPAYRQLIRAHAAAGSRAEAMKAYDDLRRVLDTELDLTPSPETAATLRRALAS